MTSRQEVALCMPTLIPPYVTRSGEEDQDEDRKEQGYAQGGEGGGEGLTGIINLTHCKLLSQLLLM